MGWFSRDRGKHEPGVATDSVVERNPLVSAEFPRFDGGGRPIIEFSPDMRAVLNLGGIRTDFGEVYRRQPAVRICVDFKADNIAHCKLKVYNRQEDGSRKEAPFDHSLVRLLEKPQNGVSGYDFVRDTVADLEVFGNAYWVIRRAGDSKALVRVMPMFVTGKGGSPVGGPTSYVVDVGGGPVPIRFEDMVHFRTYNPADVRIGVSVLEALTAILEEEADTTLHRRNFLKNSGRQEGWIERPKASGRWSRAQRREFREDWQAAHSGTNNAGKVSILEDDMKLHAYSWSPKDSEFIAGREWGLDITATAYHIPLAVLSRGGTATFASMKEFHTMVYVDTLGPPMALMEKAINTQLVPIFRDPTLFVEFNIEEKLQGDFESQAQALRFAVQVPLMSVNDGRRIRNLPPVGDPTDSNNPFNVPAQPANYNYAGQPVAPQVVTSPGPGGVTFPHPDAPDPLLEEALNGHH